MNSSSFKYKIILGLIAIFDAAYIAYYLLYGKSEANHFLVQSWVLNIYMVLYLAVSFENFKLIQGYIAPMYVPKNILVFLIPKMGELQNYTGESIKLVADQDGEEGVMIESLPVSGVLVRRIVYSGSTSWFVFIPNSPVYADEVVDNMFLVKLDHKGASLGRSEWTTMRLMGLKKAEDFGEGMVKKSDAVFLSLVQGKIVDS